MKKVILGVISFSVLLVVLVGVYKFDYFNDKREVDVDGRREIETNDFINNQNKDEQVEYYQELEKNCLAKENKKCCLLSLRVMKKKKAKLLSAGKENCQEGFKKNTLKCPGSYIWCEKIDKIEKNNKKEFPEEKNDGRVVCTKEVKECPDGSFVGRVGPHCEFAPCPTE